VRSASPDSPTERATCVAATRLSPVMSRIDTPIVASRRIAFAEIDPLQKERIVRAFRDAGETVGFLGDGINDAAALHAADVGISVDTAVDVAKQTAAIVLLEKDLGVVVDGVRLGHKTFANTLKYIRVTTSANFGNMLSMAAASAFLPFLPLLPRQILLLNFLSDIPGTTIAADDVEPEQLERPRAWDIGSIRRFMLIFGTLSSVFDVATFVALRAGIAVVTGVMPYSPLAAPLGLVAVPADIFALLIGLTITYAFANDAVKGLTGLAA
jgi:Mg2+-importing ATPase